MAIIIIIRKDYIVMIITSHIVVTIASNFRSIITANIKMELITFKKNLKKN